MTQEHLHIIRHEQPISVELSRNAKGVTEITVKIHGDDLAVTKASALYDNLRILYPYEETIKVKEAKV